MDIAVHGRHLELPDDVREHAAAKAGQLEKYLQGMERCEVLFSDGKRGHLGEPVSCEVRLVAGGRVVRAAAVGAKADEALEGAIDKAALRLTRLKKRLVSRSRPRHKVPKPNGASQPATSAEVEEP